MSYKEKDIIYENGKFWVLKNKEGYHVMVSGVTCSTSDSSYASADLAIARCDYIAKRVRNDH